MRYVFLLIFVSVVLWLNPAVSGEFGSLEFGMTYDAVESHIGEGDCAYTFSIRCKKYYYDKYKINGVNIRLVTEYYVDGFGNIGTLRLRKLSYYYKGRYKSKNYYVVCREFIKMFRNRFPNSVSIKQNGYFDTESTNIDKYTIFCGESTGVVEFQKSSKLF